MFDFTNKKECNLLNYVIQWLNLIFFCYDIVDELATKACNVLIPPKCIYHACINIIYN